MSLNKAAASAAAVSLASNNATLPVPANVTIAAGQNSATFTATSGTVASNQTATVTATLNGQSQSTSVSLTVTVVPSSLSCAPGTVNAPGSSSCTVTLSAPAPSGGVTVGLSSNNANVTVPASLSVAANQSGGTFTANVAAVSTDQTALLTASLNGGAKTFTLTASAPAQLTSVSCSPSTLASNATTSCTVSLSKAATSAAAVSLASNNATLPVPANVTIAAGQNSATFTATSGTVASNQTATVTATMNGQSQSTTVSLTVTVVPASLSCSPGTVNAPGSSSCTVTLTAPAPTGGVTVGLSSNNANVTVPASLSVAANQSGGTFTANVAAVSANQSALLTASLNGGAQTFTLNASSSVQLSSLSCAPSTLSSSMSSLCTVYLSKGSVTPFPDSLSSTVSGVLQVPTNAIVPAGSTSATFVVGVGTINSSSTAILTASAGNVSSAVTLALNGGSGDGQLQSMRCGTASLNPGDTGTCTITLFQTASSPFMVSLSGDPLLTIPSSVRANPGSLMINFQVIAGVTGSQQTVTIVGSASNSVVASTVTVMAGNPPAITAPTQLVTPAKSAVQFTATASDAYGLPITLSASGLPLGATFDPPTGKFQWMPDPTQMGRFDVAIIGTDSKGLSNHKDVFITVTAPKAQVSGLYNAASYGLDGTCSAGSLATLVGSGFTGQQGVQTASTSPWPTQLSGTQVTLNNADVPILAASDTVMQFQCPMLPAGTQISLTVKPGVDLPADPLQFTLREATPGLFILDQTYQGAVLIAGTNLVARDTTDAYPSRPAQHGEYLALFATGLGPMQEVVPAGAPAPSDHVVQTTDKVTVVIGGVEMTSSFAGLTPGYIGLDQVNVEILQAVPSGDAVPVYLKMVLSDGSVIQSNIVTVAIQDPSQ